MSTSDPYGHWRAALTGDFSGWRDEPLPGFYRLKPSRTSGWVAVAIWHDESGEVRCLVGGVLTDGWRVWDRCSHEPITEDAYRAKMAGGLFPDEFEVLGSPETTTDVLRVGPIGPPEARK